MWDGHMMYGSHGMLGMHWGGWLLSALVILLIVLVIQRTGRPHSR